MRNIALILVSLFFLGVMPARAQDEALAALSQPDTGRFPVVTAFLDVHQSGGEFVTGLGAGQVTIVEDGQDVPVGELSEVEQGAEWILSINAGPPLGIRDSDGVSRYSRIAEVLKNWASAEPASAGDTYSWFANEGSPTVRLTSRQEWLAALQTYQPDFRNSSPSLQSLVDAIDLASNASENPGTEKAILWITPPPETELAESLTGLIERARQSGTHINVWMVASPGAFESPGAAALQQLADETHGLLVPFSGSEALPDPEEYLAPLRSIYTLSYTSEIREGGDHTVAARVTTDAGEWSTPERTFQLSIQAPNPMFLSPPGEIQRTCPADSKQPLEDLKPLSYTIRTLIEFPDGKKRALKSTRYYVDGVLAAEKTKPPFDEFDWDLTAYTTSGKHTLRVEAEDALGMSKSSLEIPVDIVVTIPPASLWTTVSRNRTVLYTGSVILAGVSLVLVLFLAGRWKARAAALRARRMRDPLTQPVAPIRSSAQNSEAALDPTSRSRRGPAAQPACLIRLGEDNRPVSGAPITITGREMTFGRDPTRVTCVLDSPSIDGLHARLRLAPDGGYILSDQGSVAGTWVNYAPISTEGARLEPGDIVHIGQVAFRFSLNQPGAQRKPAVQPYQEEQ